MGSEAAAVYVSESDSDDDEDVPPKEVCEQRLQALKDVAGIDSALAMMLLQQHSWDLERAVNEFFKDDGNSKNTHFEGESKNSQEGLKRKSDEEVGNETKIPKPSSSSNNYLTVEPPVLQPQFDNVIRIMSWNIDGLDPDNLISRTKGVISVIKQEQPDVVFLQEVVSPTLDMIKQSCSKYTVHVGVDGPILPNKYFTAMLLCNENTFSSSVEIQNFPGSVMDRNLLEVQALVRGIPMNLMTSHLESTAAHSSQRKEQLRQAWARMAAVPPGNTALFGGDLNLRDSELTGSSAMPAGVLDLWESTGKRKEARYTWDLTRNDNKQMPKKYQPRSRFDRLYLRPSSPPTLRPAYWELAGIQRLQSCRRFPSDHWAVIAHLEILKV